MNPQFQTSFIPKKPISASPARLKRGVNLISLFGVIFFILAIAGSGAVFFGERYIASGLESDKAILEHDREAFDPNTVRQLIKLSDRLAVSQTVLSTHIAPSSIFSLVEQLTLQSIRFSSFNWSISEDGVSILTMRGQAEGFNAVAYQADVFGKSRFLKNPILSDLSLQNDGRVSFNFSAGIDRELTNYTGKPKTIISGGN